MLRIIFILFLFLNPAYSHDLSSEYSEFQNQISYELMANNTKKIWPFSCIPGNIAKKHPILPEFKINHVVKVNFDILENIQ